MGAEVRPAVRTSMALCLLLAGPWATGCATARPAESSTARRADQACSTRCVPRGSSSSLSFPSFRETNTPLDLVLIPVAIAGLAAGAAAASGPPPCEPVDLLTRSLRTLGPQESGLVTTAAGASSTATLTGTRWHDARMRFYAAPSDEAALAEWLMVCERSGHWDEADQAWRVFLDQPGAQPTHRLGYARWLFHQGQRDQALAQARALSALAPPPRGTASLLGQLLVASHPDEARAELERALAEDPEDTDAAEALARLPR